MGEGGRDIIDAALLASPSSSSCNEQQGEGANSDDSSFADSLEYHRSWLKRGGMHVNEIGMGLNIAIPLYFLFECNEDVHGDATSFQLMAFSLYCFLMLTAFAAHKMRTTFCIIVVPAYLTSLLAASRLGNMPFYQAITIGTLVTVAKVAVCMSACLHRYAAHAAFKCGPGTQLFVSVLGCLANQGGAIWWASQHRKHHKKCDVPGDPHSQALDGVEQAFTFFQTHRTVEEQFAPKHCDTWYLRILDTWSFVMVSLELTFSYLFGGKTGLFLAYFSSWFCQTGTLWFNISNHPVHNPEECKAVDYYNGHGTHNGWYPLFLILDFISPIFGAFVGEDNHKHHHDHVALAKRNDTDCGYYLFIYPLELLGLVWDVKLLSSDGDRRK